MLGESSPLRLRREVRGRKLGWGAFVLHLGVRDAAIPAGFPDHHQIITEMAGPMGETQSLFISFSPEWDTERAPAGERAVTITTHTAVQEWWDLLEVDEDAYYRRKDEYTERIIEQLDKLIPGFRENLTLVLPGTPVTYHYYTDRHLGMVGGFPQTSLFRARGPRTGIANLRLVGDSIFPGQSTAGVTLGAMRVVDDVRRNLKPGDRRDAFAEQSDVTATEELTESTMEPMYE
jgi:phytoene dehydrogenase-like protein